MKMKFTLAVLCLLSASVPAMATPVDTLTFTFSNPNQSAAAGGTVTFTAMSTAGDNGGDVFINFDAINGDAAPYSVDDDFLFGYALSLSPGASFTGEVFTITLPSFATLGEVFYGTYTLQGGGDSAASRILDTETFSVTTMAGGPASVTPEPSSLALLVTGVMGTAGMMRRRVFAVTCRTKRAA
jgi:hypothetical protein